MNQKVDLSSEQIQQAAQAGLTLLNTPGSVNVPGPMAISGAVQVLNALLTAIISGQVIVINPQQLMKPPEEDGKTPPEGDGEKKPDLKPVKSGKQAEK